MGQTILPADYKVSADTPIYLIFGDHTKAMNIATSDFSVMDNVKVLIPHYHDIRTILFICSAWKKTIPNLGYSRHWFIAKECVFKLPNTDKQKPDFDFMESFIAELEAERIAELEAERIAELSAYLKASGFDNYELSAEEQNALRALETLKWKEFEYQDIFNRIKQGRRLKKDDQKPGEIPFVMAGTTNTGVVNYVSNPVASFPENSITIDIFGNAFYRAYSFGAGDDTGVYWNSKKKYSKETMLFFAASMEKSIAGKFSYGKKLRSSQSLNFKMKLPALNGEPDFDKMELLISAIQKLVIKDVVKYSDAKISAAKQVVQ